MTAAGTKAVATGTSATAGVQTVTAAAVGLAFGPSVIAVLAFGVFINPIEAEFGWSRVEVSLASTLIAYMIMAVSPIQGLLVDRYGPRRVILASIPLFGIGLALFHFLPARLGAFYGLWALIPLLAIGLWPLAYLQSVSYWFDRRLGLALGIANGGIGVGTTLVPMIASFLIVAVGWRNAFVALGAIVVLVTWPVAFFWLREPKSEEPAAGAKKMPTFGMEFKEAVRTRQFVLLAIVFLVLGLTLTGLVVQQIPMLIDAGWSPQRAAMVQSAFGMALLAARIGVGYVIDRLFAPWVMTCIAIGGAAGCVLYAAIPSAAFASAILIGLVVGAEFDVLAFLIKRYFGTRAFGKLYGTLFAVFQLTAGVSVLSLAMTRQILGSYVPGLYGIAASLVLAAILMLGLGPYVFAAEQPQK